MNKKLRLQDKKLNLQLWSDIYLKSTNDWLFLSAFISSIQYKNKN